MAKQPNKNLVQQYSSLSFSAGPLPPASEIKKYEEILSGAADRILSMAEDQSKHRQEIEKNVVDSGIKNQIRGQVFAFIIVCLAFFLGTFLIHTGKDIMGIASIISALTALVGAFIYATRSNRKERERKQT